jgi:hypothetical protein
MSLPPTSSHYTEVDVHIMQDHPEVDTAELQPQPRGTCTQLPEHAVGGVPHFHRPGIVGVGALTGHRPGVQLLEPQHQDPEVVGGIPA